MARFSIALAGLAALLVIGLTASLVVTKDYPADLAVSVKGVPGYVYYDRPYDITFEYENRGGSVAESATLSVVLPADFALDGAGATASERSVVWHIGDIGPGEHGSVTATLRGTLPSDLTGAVYDLPGYADHTAFVDGLSLEVALTAGDAVATAHALADTGEPNPCVDPQQPGRCLFVFKETNPASNQVFNFSFLVNGFGPIEGLEDGDFFGFPLPAAGTPLIVTEDVPAGWELEDISCSQEVNVIVESSVPQAELSVEGVGTALSFAICTFTNERIETPTATPTATPTNTPTATATPTTTPTPEETRPPHLGAFLNTNQGAITATSVPQAAAPAISPPSTGDGGLK